MTSKRSSYDGSNWRPSRRRGMSLVVAASLTVLLLGTGIAALLAQNPATEKLSPRERLEAMSPQEKEELAAKRTRYEQLSEAERNRIRKLDEQLAADPDAEQLRGVMNRYYEWLKTLSADERATLLSKTGEERIDMIRIISFRGMADRRLSTEDLESVFEWTNKYLRSREARMLESLPEHRREEVLRIADESRRWHRLFWLMRSRQLSPHMIPTEEEVAELIANLSADAQAIFAAAPDDNKKRELVQGWIRAAMFSRFMQSISEEDLMTFFHEELDPRKRAEIEALPREEMQKELRKYYMFHKFRGFGGGPPRFRPPGHDDDDHGGRNGRSDRDDNRGRGGRGPDRRPPPDAPPGNGD